MRGRDIMIGLIAAAAGAAATFAATTSVGTPVAMADKATIERIVRDYILDHPEILPQAMERLQARELAKTINANRKLIETPYAGAWEGSANADVTVVQFFDYACGYCRASLPDIDRLLKDDPKLKIVYRELPVLGPDSEAAAHLSLAVATKGGRRRDMSSSSAFSSVMLQNIEKVSGPAGPVNGPFGSAGGCLRPMTQSCSPAAFLYGLRAISKKRVPAARPSLTSVRTTAAASVQVFFSRLTSSEYASTTLTT